MIIHNSLAIRITQNDLREFAPGGGMINFVERFGVVIFLIYRSKQRMSSYHAFLLTDRLASKCGLILRLSSKMRSFVTWRLFSKRMSVTFITWGILGKHFRPAGTKNKPSPHGVSTLLVRPATAWPVGSFANCTFRNYHVLIRYFSKKGELLFYYPRQNIPWCATNARSTNRHGLEGSPGGLLLILF